MPVSTPGRRLPARAVAPRATGARERAAQATRDSILHAAIKVFARDGYDGGRIEQISKAARSYDRMIYYYFGSKEGLFVEVLEEIYRRFNEAEAGLELDLDEPVAALKSVIHFVWTYYQAHPEFITLLNTENLHKGRHISRSLRATEYSSPAVGLIDSVLASGVRKGVFRGDLRARDVYLMIVGMCYFYLSNRHTLSVFLGEELEASSELARWESFIADSVLRVVSPAAAPRESTPASRAGADR